MSPSLPVNPIVQQDFGGGMDVSRRPELVAPNGLVGAINGLYDDVGVVYRRGGSSMRSTSVLAPGTPLTFLWDGWLDAGQRTLIANTTTLATESGGTLTALGGPGVASPARAAAFQGKLYLPGGQTYDGTTLATAAKVAPYYTTVLNRLLAADGRVVYMGDIGAPAWTVADEEWDLPGGADIVGLEGLRDSAAVFTTNGIWLISNLGFLLTDTDGNTQQRLDHYSSDIVLWGGAGIAAWQGGLIVPAVDAVWLVSLGVTSEVAQPFNMISRSIRPLYQDYVKRGYRPGLATVYRSHYILPILNGAQVVDLLACKLDARDERGKLTYPWSQLRNEGGRVSGVAVHQEPGAPRPTLIGAGENGRLMNLAFLEPGTGAANDADGSTFPLDVLLRSYPTGSLNKNTATKLRVAYQLQGGPSTVVVEDATDWGEFDWGESSWGSSENSLSFADPTLKAYTLEGHPPPGSTEWGLFDWGGAEWSTTSVELALVGEAPLDVYGITPYSWPVRSRERFVQFRLRCEGNAAVVQLKSVEVLVRSNRRL